MSSPIQLLKKGIQDQNWILVCRAYEGLTGEKLTIPSVDNTDYRSLLNRLSQLVDEENAKLRGAIVPAEVPQEPPKKRSRKKKATSGNTTSSTVKKAMKEAEEVLAKAEQEEAQTKSYEDPYAKFRIVSKETKVNNTKTPNKPNRFQDDLTLAAGEELEMSKKFSQSAPAKSHRPKPRKVKATCDQCKGEEMVDATLAPRRDENGDMTIFLCRKCLRG